MDKDATDRLIEAIEYLIRAIDTSDASHYRTLISNAISDLKNEIIDEARKEFENFPIVENDPYY